MAARRSSLPRETIAMLAVGILVTVADQVTKAAVIANLGVQERASLIGDFIIVWHLQNRGASFSLLQGASWFFILVTIVAVGLIAAYHRSLLGRPLWLHAVLGVVLGGALGNFVDRVRLGYVTDFVSVGFGDLRFPAFNVADSSLTVGIVVLLGWLVFRERAASRVGG
jgi:signal peptidase II